MPSSYVNTRSKYYATLLYLVGVYGYTRDFSSASSGINCHTLSAMNNRGMFDYHGQQKVHGKQWKTSVYSVKRDVFNQVIDQQSK